MKNSYWFFFFGIGLLSITSIKAEFDFFNKSNSAFQLKGVGQCNGGGSPSPEVCDNIDNDCNGTPDDNAIDALLWCEDSDQDGFGYPYGQLLSCEQPNDYVSNCGDCDDSDINIGGGCEINIFTNGFESLP